MINRVWNQLNEIHNAISMFQICHFRFKVVFLSKFSMKKLCKVKKKMQLLCSMLITINIDNVGTISNVYWSDSIFFSCEVWCQLGIEITNVQLLFIESYSTLCKRIWIPESGKFCLWNPESEMFCWWNLESGIFCLWNLESGIFCFWNPESEIFAC